MLAPATRAVSMLAPSSGQTRNEPSFVRLVNGHVAMSPSSPTDSGDGDGDAAIVYRVVACGYGGRAASGVSRSGA